jgi:hypothetical protein
MPGPQEWRIGSHVLSFEPPDLLWIFYGGVLSLADAAQVVGIHKRLGAAQRFFVVSDMKDLGLLEPEVGRYISEHMDSSCLLATVHFGARLAQKAVARGIVLASQMTERAGPEDLARVHFVDTKDEALALVARLRARVSPTGR